MQLPGLYSYHSIRREFSAIVGALVFLMGHTCIADSRPAKPLRIVVPYAAGGTADVAARLIVQKHVTRLGQPVMVESKPGAGIIIGLQSALGSIANRYTLVLIATGFEGLSAIHTKLPFNPTADLSLIAMIGSAPYIFFTHPSRPEAYLHSPTEFSNRLREGSRVWGAIVPEISI